MIIDPCVGSSLPQTGVKSQQGKKKRRKDPARLYGECEIEARFQWGELSKWMSPAEAG